MATFNLGILGGFIGKVGTVVGYHLKGQNVMRSLAQHPSNPNTEAQQAVRARFTLITRLVTACLGTVQFGFPNRPQTHSAVNAAVSINSHNGCIIGTGTDISIDYTKVALSSGHGILPGAPSAQVAAANTVLISWTDNSGISPEVLSSDHVIACLYNPSRHASSYDASSSLRGDESLTLSYPALWAGDQAHLFLFVASRDYTLVSPTLLVATLSLT